MKFYLYLVAAISLIGISCHNPDKTERNFGSGYPIGKYRKTRGAACRLEQWRR